MADKTTKIDKGSIEIHSIQPSRPPGDKGGKQGSLQPSAPTNSATPPPKK